MTNEEYLKLKIGQTIYSNYGTNPLKIIQVPRIGEYNDFIVMDIHDCKHVEFSKYIEENFDEIKPQIKWLVTDTSEDEDEEKEWDFDNHCVKEHGYIY